MKICFLVADITFKGGIERVLSNLTNALILQWSDLDITIASQYKTNDQPNYPFNDRIKIDYLSKKTYSGAPGSLGRLNKHFRNLYNLRKYFKKHKFNIICSQSFTNTQLLALSGTPLNNVIAVEHVYYGYYNKIIRMLRKLLYPKLLGVGVLTTYDQKYYSSWLKNVVLIPNPIEVTNKYHSTLTSKSIIAIGRLEEQKNFAQLIDIFARISTLHPDWTLNIFGEGTLRNSLQTKIESLRLEQKVFLRGTTENIDQEIRKSSFLVMTSLYEGFGMVLIEALRNGVPCISYDCPAGPSDIIIDRENGLLIPEKDIAKMEEAINLLIEDNELRLRLGENAPESINQFASSVIASKWIDIFKRYNFKLSIDE